MNFNISSLPELKALGSFREVQGAAKETFGRSFKSWAALFSFIMEMKGIFREEEKIEKEEEKDTPPEFDFKKGKVEDFFKSDQHMAIFFLSLVPPPRNNFVIFKSPYQFPSLYGEEYINTWKKSILKLIHPDLWNHSQAEFFTRKVIEVAER